MKTKRQQNAARPPASAVSEVLILADGTIFAHNISPAMAKIIAGLNPADAAMRRRAGEQQLNHELSN